jgi:hypothetical protein
MSVVEIRVHPLNLDRLLRDACERGARVTTSKSGLWKIDDLPVILDPYIDIRAKYAVSHSGGQFWR